MRQLWAPWRMEFIRSADCASECFLCRAARGDDESLLLRRGNACFCMLNRYPYSNGHLLISPLRHVAGLEHLTDAEMLDLLRLARDGRAALAAAANAHGYNLGLNLGRAAGAGLEDHLHLHLVPRWIGDTNFMPVVGDVKIIPQALAEMADLLRRHWPEGT